MAFLKSGSDFPPEEWSYWFDKYKEYAAWYSGDPNELLAYYTTQALNMENGPFWARTEAEERTGVVHLPAAGDIASTSGDLLFAEAPRLRYDQASESGKRITEFLKENGLNNLLLEGAELSAALGGCFLKLDIEPQLARIPLVSIVSPLQAFPTFWRGRLCEVLFFRTVKTQESGSVVWRLFENRSRENGGLKIEYKLYKGQHDKLGREYDFNAIEETSKLNLKPVFYSGFSGLACVYVPNKRPNILDPNSYLGINDYSSSITLMDSLDFAWTSWMRDIELGMAQILVDEALLDRAVSTGTDTAYEKARFSKFRKAFIKLNMEPWRMSGEAAKPIEPIQFNLRVEEHSKTCERLFAEIVGRCGYSERTFGLTETIGQAASGSALRIRERKSLLTRQKKSRYWQPAIWELLWQMQQLDMATNLNSFYTPQEVDIELEDSIVTDSKEVSETIRNIDQARAASTYTKVKILHPEWEEPEILNEVDQILKESGVVENPFDTEREDDIV